MFLNIYEKIHQFLLSIERDAHKRKLVPFFFLMVTNRAANTSVLTKIHKDVL